MQYALEVNNIKKYFGDVKANDGISIKLEKGSIHCLAGENGAGKTTLVKSLCGLHQPDSGEIILNGKSVTFSSPNDAIHKGLGIVHQHFMLVEEFSVLENILLGAEPKAKLILKKEEGKSKIQELCNKYNFNVDLNAKVRDLPVGLKQKVEILKILYRGTDIIILDEPTAVLTPQEIEGFFDILRDLVKNGCSVILITHKLKEIMSLGDYVTIIRDGKSIKTHKIQDVNEKIIANEMVGREVSLEVDREENETGEIVLKVCDLSFKSKKRQNLENISFDIKEGEIFGIIGVAGNGQEELVDNILGVEKVQSGYVSILNESKNNKTFRESGNIGCIPSDRLKEGLVKEFSVLENSILGFQHDERILKNKIFLSKKEIIKRCEAIVKDNYVKTPSINSSILNLSGGNQQKLIIGREIENDPKLIIAQQPTRGVDIGAIEFIYENLMKKRKEKKAILLVSNELEEVLSLSDKVCIMFEGKIMGMGNSGDFTKEQIGMMMAGIKMEEVINNEG